MTKKEEEKLLKKIDMLERMVAKLQEAFENNKLEKSFYTVNEVSQILNKTPRTVYKMIDRGELDAIKLGSIKVRGASLNELLKGVV